MILQLAATVTYIPYALDPVRLHHEEAHSEVLMDSSQCADTLTVLTFILLGAACSLLL